MCPPELRTKLRKMRRDLACGQRARYDQAIRQHLLQLVESRSVSSLAAYWSFDGEPDIIPLCRQLLDKGADIALPTIAASGTSMEFHAWKPDEMLEQNRFGIQQPANSEKIPLSGVDLLVMPLVGYDRLGNRLGVGAGFYDRYLESMRNSPAPLRIGVAYSLQEVELINNNDWDIPKWSKEFWFYWINMVISGFRMCRFLNRREFL